jgi:hypothetical protein
MTEMKEMNAQELSIIRKELFQIHSAMNFIFNSLGVLAMARIDIEEEHKLNGIKYTWEYLLEAHAKAIQKLGPEEMPF